MLIVVLIIFGLAFGSFVNAWIWRLHVQSEDGGKQKNQKYSIVSGRSICPSCKHVLSAKDLIPVLSWISLRGKCRYCGKRFDDTPFSELLVPALFVLSYLFWPFAWAFASIVMFVLWLAIIVGLVALALSDKRWYILPNRIVFPLQAVAATLAMIGLFAAPEAYSLLGVGFSLLFSAGLFWALYQVSKGKWIGYGDVKLAVVIGLVLGKGELAFLMLFIASLLGSVVAVPLMITGKAGRKSQLPFGPFLIAATILTFLFGTGLIDWYRTQFLFF